MTTKTDDFIKKYQKIDIPNIRPGDTVQVSQKVKEKDKERIQKFEGLVIAKKHGKGISGTITVRKVISGIGVEKVFPLHTPTIEKIEVLKHGKVRRGKLYYLRTAKGKKARLKRTDFIQAIAPEEPTPTIEIAPETKPDIEKEEK